MDEDGAFSNKINYVSFFFFCHPNRITGSKVTAILLNGLIFPVCGVALGRVCAQPAKQAYLLGN